MTICDLSDVKVKPQNVPPRAQSISQPRNGPASKEVRSWLLAGMMQATSPMPDVTDLISRPSWHKDAACRGKGTEKFILPKGSGELLEAKRTCDSCPVTEECLKFALNDPGIKGIWAGTSARERDRMRAAARKANADGLASSSETSAAAS
jgi:WhiB family redox-sensing transcriptional regulator